MAFKSNKSKPTATFNKYGLHLRWPRVWIIILGLILIFLCLSIAGMEVGHTIFDIHRSTAFGGFIIFIPLMICAIFVLITGKFKYLTSQINAIRKQSKLTNNKNILS
jgi:hypothetical protein